MKRVFSLLLFALVLAGCGPRATESGYRALLEGYRGQHIDQLVNAWGPPQDEYVYADGRRLYSFIRHRREYVQSVYPVFGLGFYSGNFFGAYYPGFYPNRAEIRDYACETRVTTDRKGYITDYNFRGEACRALPPEQGRPADYRARGR